MYPASYPSIMFATEQRMEYTKGIVDWDEELLRSLLTPRKAKKSQEKPSEINWWESLLIQTTPYDRCHPGS